MITRQEFDALLAAFVEDDEFERSMKDVGPDDNLFDAGALDSFSVVRLIGFLEQHTGRPIDLDGASIESFSTANSIYRTFVQSSPLDAV